MITRSYNSMIRDAVNMANAMNRMVSSDYSRNGGYQAENEYVDERATRLPIDAWTDENTFYLSAYLPGVKPDEVEITVEGDDLTIRGSFPQASEETNFIKRELYRGRFERSITFNTPIDVDQINASFENGMLMLTVPKAESVKPRRIQVQTA